MRHMGSYDEEPGFGPEYYATAGLGGGRIDPGIDVSHYGAPYTGMLGLGSSGDGLGTIGPAPLGIGSKAVGGYYIRGLVGPAGDAPNRLRSVASSVFPAGRVTSVGWGPSHGVPSGHLYVELETGRDTTGAELNSIFARIGQQLQASGIGSVTNTHAHVTQTTVPGGATAPATTRVTQPGTMTDFTSLIPGMAPPTPSYDSTSPMTPYPGTYPGTYQGAQPGFFQQTVAGMPVWALGLVGVAVVGGVAVVASRRPKRPSVAANRRRRRRR